MCVTYFYIISEHIVEGNLQRRYSCKLTFAVPYLFQSTSGIGMQPAEFVKLGIDTGSYGIPPPQLVWRVIHNHTGYSLVKLRSIAHFPRHPDKHLRTGFRQHIPQSVCRPQRIAQRDKIPRTYSIGSQFRHKSLKISDAPESLLASVATRHITEEILHGILTPRYLLNIQQRKRHPRPQLASTHGGDRLVDHLEKREPLFRQRIKKLKIAYREFVESHVPVAVDACKRSYMRDIGVLGEVEIIQQTARRHNRLMHAVHTESLERCRAEMFYEAFGCRIRGVDPVFKFEDTAFVRDILFAELPCAMHAQQLLRSDIRYQFVNIILVSLRTEELSGRKVEKRHTDRRLSDMYAGKKIVFARPQGIVVQIDAWSDKLSYPPFHELFGEFGVFELFAYRHTLARPYEFREI